MARSSYLRSLAGSPPRGIPLLRPARVPAWARLGMTGAFGDISDSRVAAAESAIPGQVVGQPIVSAAALPTASIESRPLAAQDVDERESKLADKPTSAAAPVVRPLAVDVQLAAIPQRSPVRRNTVESPAANPAIEGRSSHDLIEPGKSEPRTRAVAGVSADATGLARTNLTPAPLPSPRVRTTGFPATLSESPLPTVRFDGKSEDQIPQAPKARSKANDQVRAPDVEEPRPAAFHTLPRLPGDDVRAPASTADDARQGNSVRIGRVEIHVTPPPPMSRQPAPQAAVSTSAISRGLTSAFGFTQG
jgi:hypothetical protein